MVGDDGVEATERGVRGVDERVRRCRVGEVHRHVLDGPPGRAQLGDQAAGDPGTDRDPAAGAGDQDDASVECGHG